MDNKRALLNLPVSVPAAMSFSATASLAVTVAHVPSAVSLAPGIHLPFFVRGLLHLFPPGASEGIPVFLGHVHHVAPHLGKLF